MQPAEYIDPASSLEDLKVPLRNRLHVLTDDREDQYFLAFEGPWDSCPEWVARQLGQSTNATMRSSYSA